MRRWVGTAAAALLLTSIAGCGSDDAGGSAEGEETTLTVFAASSLTDSFSELGKRFEKSHDGVSVTFNFAGSSDLVAQLQQGAPADVFASADPENMDKAVADDLVEGEVVNFASNTLQIAVPPDNPGNVSSLQDLAKPGLNVVVCAPEVPCGSASTDVEKAGGIDIKPVSEEQAVTDVLAKVTTGQADAGLVYVTDVIAAGDDVKGVSFPESSEAVNVYPIAPLKDSENPELAQEFVDLVTSQEGQQVLQHAGFAKP
ncbi:MAG: molybdate ABC transporter substrate-binding protein [Nocardioidaceae bacterium]